MATATTPSNILAMLDAQNEARETAIARFVLAHDNVTGAKWIWRGAASYYEVEVRLPHWTTIGHGTTLESALDSVTGTGRADAAIFGLIFGERAA